MVPLDAVTVKGLPPRTRGTLACMTVPSENRPATRAAAARLAGVSAPTIAGWITKGWLPAAPPWTATALAEAKARASNSGPPFTAEHGSVSRYRAGCRCEPCQQAHVDDTTSRCRDAAKTEILGVVIRN